MHRLWSDGRAVAATEFALILPFMVLLLVGVIDISGAINADRKVSRIANSTTDLVAQAQTLDTNDLDDILALGGKIMAPESDDTLTTIIASITFDGKGNATVDWSYDSEQNTPWAQGSVPPITFPETVAAPETSIVIAQSTLIYTPPFSGMFFAKTFPRLSQYTLRDVFYLRPRLTNTVSCTDC
ncbi:hypothetical protein DCO57_18395 [Labrenzia sp. 011]|nr:hypothetical protein DCO57_18395 [Labrenzia sp. 011]